MISNPAARKSSAKTIELAVRLFEQAGWDVTVLQTQAGGHATELAKQAVNDGASLVVAAGGDGTFNEVMNGLAGGAVPMAVLPSGTTNVLAKELKIPGNARGAVKRILEGHIREVHVGSMAFPDGCRRKFFLMAGIGFDAEAVYHVSGKIKKKYGKAGYLAGGLKILKHWSPEPKIVLIDGNQYLFFSLVICKGARYGGYPKMAPGASIMDDELYAVVMSGRKRTDVFRYAFGIITGLHTRYKDVAYIKCRDVQVLDAARIQADGDYIGNSPVLIETAKEKLKMIF